MRKIIAFLLAAAALIAAVIPAAYAKDDNATAGEGTTHPAAEGFAWYNSYQYMYKVTVYAGRSGGAGKQSSLTGDFHRIGTVIMKKSGWTVGSSVLFGSGAKPDYYSGSPMTVWDSPLILSDPGCPKIPVVCGGDIDAVKQYFGSTGTLRTVLNALASRRGCSAYGLLRDLEFEIEGVKKRGWPEEYLMPDGINNRIPWLIIYEPVMLLHLKDKTSCVAFTATEFAVAALNGWYDWQYSRGKGQAVASLTDRHMPSSVQLEESWFGYPVYPVREDGFRWNYTDVIKGGGWGMRWLPAASPDGIDLSARITEYDPSPVVGAVTALKIRWTNGSSVQLTVPCEIMSGDYTVTSYDLTIPANSSVTKTMRLVYNYPGLKKMTARINYAGRHSETDPENNVSSVTVTPLSSAVPLRDYGCYFGGVETPLPDSHAQADVTWRNYKQDAGTVLCELFLDGTPVWSGQRTLDGREFVTDTYSIYYPGDSKRVLTARINYLHRTEETDPEDNISERDVVPRKETVAVPDFSVSDLTVTPDEAYEGDYVNVSFRSDSWNRDAAFEDVPVELQIDGETVASVLADYEPYGTNYHTFRLSLGKSGTKTVSARVNWEKRYEESSASNNLCSAEAVCLKACDFSAEEIRIEPGVCGRNGTAVLTFCTTNRDSFNTYENVPVQVMCDGRAVYTGYFGYAPGERRYHTVILSPGERTGVLQIRARVNWTRRAEETDAFNNETAAVSLTVEGPEDLWIESVDPGCPYTAGTEVISSYLIRSALSRDVTPENGCEVAFKAFFKEEGEPEAVIAAGVRKNAVVPAGESNLVYFRWTVPSDAAGRKVYVRAEIRGAGPFDRDPSDNTALIENAVSAYSESDTPDTRYERSAPSGFVLKETPEGVKGRAGWQEWIYESGAFRRADFGICVSVGPAEIYPDGSVPSAAFLNGSTMRSGYAFGLTFTVRAEETEGTDMPDSGAYTDAQTAYVLFPEFGYSRRTGAFRSLEKVSGEWSFRANPYDGQTRRVHFTPLWFPDGRYVIFLCASDVWTPAGRIDVSAAVSAFEMRGSAYDDWFLGR